MGRLEKLKRQVIEESNKRVLEENIPRGVYDPESDFEYDEEVINIFHDITRYFNERTENIDFVQYKELSKKLGRWFLGGM
jgi:hypothetical protein